MSGQQPGSAAWAPTPRMVFHALGSAAFPVLAFFVSRELLLYALGGFTAAFFLFELLRLASPPVNRWFLATFRPLLRETETFRLNGSAYVLAGSLVAFLVFPREMAILALLFLAVGDPLAALVGRALGKVWAWGKALEGHLAFFAAALVLGLGVGWWLLGLSPLIVAVGAAAAAIIQALPLPLSDNITIPLAAALAMALSGLWLPAMI